MSFLLIGGNIPKIETPPEIIMLFFIIRLFLIGLVLAAFFSIFIIIYQIFFNKKKKNNKEDKDDKDITDNDDNDNNDDDNVSNNEIQNDSKELAKDVKKDIPKMITILFIFMYLIIIFVCEIMIHQKGIVLPLSIIILIIYILTLSKVKHVNYFKKYKRIIIIPIISFLLYGFIFPSGEYDAYLMFLEGPHPFLQIELKKDHTFTYNHSYDADHGSTYYTGKYYGLGLLLLKGDTEIIDANDFDISLESNLTYLGHNRYSKKISEKNVGLVIGRYIILFNPFAILRK